VPGIKLDLDQAKASWNNLPDSDREQLQAMGSADPAVATTAILKQGFRDVTDLSKLQVPVFEGINANDLAQVHFSMKPIDLVNEFTPPEIKRLTELFAEDRDGLMTGTISPSEPKPNDADLVARFRESAKKQLMDPYKEAFRQLEIA
jgi:hypothetical protein